MSIAVNRGKARQLRDAAGDNDPAGIDAVLESAQDFAGILNNGDFVGKTALHWCVLKKYETHHSTRGGWMITPTH